MLTTTDTKKINSELKTFIVRAITEILADPDFGLEFTEKAKKRLRDRRDRAYKQR